MSFFTCNLKKVLALVLAFACAFTMFASAAFTDQADIKVDSDVVDTLVSLGVVNGYDDGSFKPNGTVTRAEMAKMIYVLRTGNSDASAYNDDKTSFTDIGTHWARGYIKYCQSLGIIAGKSNTKFVPNDKVTAQEAAKMLLVTLGYDANKAGLVGINWTSRTNALADENGLLEDVNTSFTGPCPRQYAAQLIYNAIDAPTVVWRDDAYTTNNYGNGDNPTIGEKYMGLHSVEGILTYFQKEDGKSTYNATVENITKKDGTTLFGKDIIAEQNFTKIAKDYFSMKNQKVKVLYKESDKVYGIFALTDSNTVISGLLGDFGEDGGKLKYDGKKYSLANPNTVYVNNSDVKAADVANYADAAKGITKAYNATAISNNDSAKISRLDVAAFAVAQVTYVGKDYINVSYKANNGTQGNPTFKTKLEADDVTYPSSIKKGDYVAVTADVNTADGNVGVTKLDLVTGKITTTKKSPSEDGYKITIDGTTYEKAGDPNGKVKDLTLNSTVSIVVKGDYFVFVDDTNAEAKDIGMMTEIYKEGNRFVATVIKADGSSQKMTLKKTDGYYENGTSTTPKEFDSAVKNGTKAPVLVSYSKSGDDYKVKVLSDKEKAGYDVFDTQTANTVDNKRFTKTTSGKVVSAIDDNATVFVRYKTDSYKVVTGKDLKNWKDTVKFDSTVLADASNSVNYAKVVMADLKDDSMAGGSDVNYGYVYTVESGSNTDEDEYKVIYAWNGSETVELWSDDMSQKISTGNVVEYSIDGNVETVNGAKTEVTIDNIYGKDNNAWTKAAVLGGDYGTDKKGTAYVYATTADVVAKNVDTTAIKLDKDDDAIILFVDTSDDGKNDTGLALSDNMDLSSFAQDTGDGYKVNAVFFKTTDKNGETGKNIIVIDTTGELDNSITK